RRASSPCGQRWTGWSISVGSAVERRVRQRRRGSEGEAEHRVRPGADRVPPGFHRGLQFGMREDPKSLVADGAEDLLGDRVGRDARRQDLAQQLSRGSSPPASRPPSARGRLRSARSMLVLTHPGHRTDARTLAWVMVNSWCKVSEMATTANFDAL